MLMFLHRTNILPAGVRKQTKSGHFFLSDISRLRTFYLLKQHFNSKNAWQPVVGGMFPTLWSPPSCPDNHNDFFSSIILYFVCFFLQIATWTMLLIHHCVEISIILSSISKSTLPWTAVHDYETKNEYSSNRHSSNQSTIQRKH